MKYFRITLYSLKWAQTSQKCDEPGAHWPSHGNNGCTSREDHPSQHHIPYQVYLAWWFKPKGLCTWRTGV